MDDKLTHKSQDAVSVAVRRAAADGSPQVDPLHLLLALVEQADGTTAPLLRAELESTRAVAARLAELRRAGSNTTSGLVPVRSARAAAWEPATGQHREEK